MANRFLKLIVHFLPLLFFFIPLHAQEGSLPPPQPYPVVIETSFYLQNIDKIEEHIERFDPHFYIDFRWKDPRLAFTPQEGEAIVKTYLEDAATDMLTKIWWPYIDFTNAVFTDFAPTTVNFNNQTLSIYCNGTVELSFGITGSFRTPLDLRRFPFDRHFLDVRVSSFLWDNSKVVFQPTVIGFAKPPLEKDTPILITGIKAYVENFIAPSYEAATYSTYVARIDVKRDPTFYIYQMIIPLFLILGISFCVLFFRVQNIADKIYLTLSSILTFFAIKFTVNYDIPTVGYMTLLDKLFLITYIFGGLIVVASLIDYPILKGEPTVRRRFDKRVRWLMPIAFIVIVIILFCL